MMKNFLILAGAAAFVAATPAVAKPGHAKGHGNEAKHGKYYAYGNACPPGLRKKNNGCMPPGQWKKRYNIGQRYASNYGSRWSYNQIPYDLRRQYNFDPNYRYYYGDGYLYQVNPQTMLIQQVVNAILR